MPPVIRCFPLSEPWHRQALTPEGGDGRHNWDLICNSPHCLAASVSEAKLQLKCNRSSFFSFPFVWSWSLGFWSISFFFFFNYSLFKQSTFFFIQYFWMLLCSYYLILFWCISRIPTDFHKALRSSLYCMCLSSLSQTQTLDHVEGRLMNEKKKKKVKCAKFIQTSPESLAKKTKEVVLLSLLFVV